MAFKYQDLWPKVETLCRLVCECGADFSDVVKGGGPITFSAEAFRQGWRVVEGGVRLGVVQCPRCAVDSITVLLRTELKMRKVERCSVAAVRYVWERTGWSLVDSREWVQKHYGIE